jgi:diaminohydroxyphosphoribosylaminopyrimidine deaminase/5-amino-6-(5-phosphoribosylamino)uracil reductase
MSLNAIAQARDSDFMQQALAQAALGLYSTTPNPRVGCVLVAATGEVVGQGYHVRAGEGHAEVNALAAAGERARGATAYVTLEPCDHHGRTGPCSQALIDAGVAEVVYAMQDLNPLVAGKGLARLRRAGIAVRGPVLEAEAVALNLGFIKRMQTGLPYVRCKLAMSLDGRTAMANGESQWITGPAAREDVQKLRARSCSIITGAGTVLADNPLLNVRSLALGANPRQPLRIVIDSQLRTPTDAQIYAAPEQTVVATTQPVNLHGAVTAWSLDGEKVDLAALIRRLGEQGHNEVLIEAGPALAGAFMVAGLIDELVVYMAGKLMGSTARPLVDLPLAHMADSIALNISAVQPVGDDWRIIAKPIYS